MLCIWSSWIKTFSVDKIVPKSEFKFDETTSLFIGLKYSLFKILFVYRSKIYYLSFLLYLPSTFKFWIVSKIRPNVYYRIPVANTLSNNR